MQSVIYLCIKQAYCTNFTHALCIDRHIHPFASHPICSLMGFQNRTSSGRDVAKHDTLLSAKKDNFFRKTPPFARERAKNRSLKSGKNLSHRRYFLHETTKMPRRGRGAHHIYINKCAKTGGTRCRLHSSCQRFIS